MKVILIAAISADGYIGLDPSQRSMDWTSPEDRKLLIELSKKMGVIVMGSTTYKTFRIKRAPPERRLIIYTSRPETIEGEGVETTSLHPKELVAQLEREGASGLAVEGGSSVYRQFLEHKLVDELYLTVEPHLFGKGVPLLDQACRQQLKLLDTYKLNDDTVLLHYKILR